MTALITEAPFLCQVCHTPVNTYGVHITDEAGPGLNGDNSSWVCLSCYYKHFYQPPSSEIVRRVL